MTKQLRTLFAVLSLFGIFVMLIAAYWILNSISSSEIKIPELVGKEMAAASGELKKIGLGVEVSTEPGPDTMIGRVGRMTPPAGAAVKQGRIIVLHVISGEAMVIVPELIGVSLTEAENLLNRAGGPAGVAGLRLVVVEKVPSDSFSAVILEQNPAAGVELKAGASVDVKVAVAKDGTPIPNLVGKTLTQAQEDLAALGYTIGAREPYITSQMEPDIVISQNPPAGTKLGPESFITVRASEFPGRPSSFNNNGIGNLDVKPANATSYPTEPSASNVPPAVPNTSTPGAPKSSVGGDSRNWAAGR